MNTGKVPQETSAVCPYMMFDDVDAALAFYEKAFGLQTKLKVPGPEGKTMHAQINHGSVTIMLGRAMGHCADVAKIDAAATPPISLYVYVEDVDKIFERALAAGCTEKAKPTDQFYGDRTCGVIDPFGHYWGFGTHQREVSPAEMDAALEAMSKA